MKHLINKSAIRTSILATSLLIVFLGSPAFALPAIGDNRVEKLKTQKISVGSQALTAEIADTLESRERGLMYRKSMPADAGMLFIFEKPQPMAFWMKNTVIPLSIGYFDINRKLIGVCEMTPPIIGEMQPKTYPSQGEALYALEMNKGWFERHRIKSGAELKLPQKPIGPSR